MHVHFIGIGGAGMSALAEILLARGESISGSDSQASAKLEALSSMGATIAIGHSPENIDPSVELVVYSSAVRGQKNPEFEEAERRGIRLVRRAEFLAEVVANTQVIAIAGTHGKTTTTAMLAEILQGARFDPTVVAGAALAGLDGNNALNGGGKFSVVEADEFDRSFLALAPAIAVITNLEAEHLDIYSGLDDLKASFVQFANQGPGKPDGFAVIAIDDQNLRSIAPQLQKKLVTFGIVSTEAKYRACSIRYDGLSSHFSVLRAGEKLIEIRLPVPGEHNVRNALGAIATADILGIEMSSVAASLANFKGVERRLQIKGEAQGILVIDDYAHHPTELRASLAAVHGAYPKRRVVAVFQPHTYTRTRDFAEEFALALSEGADEIVLLDVYPARETPLPGVTSGLIYDALTNQRGRTARWIRSLDEAPEEIVTIARAGDIVVTIGAGSVTAVNGRTLELLRTNTSHSTSLNTESAQA